MTSALREPAQARDGRGATPIVLNGSDGLQRLSALSTASTFQAASPDEFRSAVARMVFDRVTVETFAATPHQCDHKPSVVGGNEDTVSMVFLLEGRIHSRQGTDEFDLTAGEFSVMRTTMTYWYRAIEPIRVIRATVPSALFPKHLVVTERMPVGAFERTRLVSSVIAFLRQLSAAPVGAADNTAYLARALTDLVTEVLSEAEQRSSTNGGSDGLRYRILEYIDAHLADPDLGPRMIADALELSVRYVHRVFNTEDVTIAQYVRDRRLDAIATDIRTEVRFERVGALSERFGFSGTDQLTRAFKRRFGMTIGQYQESQHPVQR